MPKIYSFIACILLLVISIYGVFGPVNRIQAAEECRKKGYTYFTDPSPIPEGITSPNVLYITLSGIPDGHYKLRFGINAFTTVYSGEVNPANLSDIRSIASAGRLRIPVNDEHDKLKRGPHTGTLLKWREPIPGSPGVSAVPGDWEEHCGSVTYKVGYEPDECRIKIEPGRPDKGEDFTVNVRTAPAGTYAVYIEGSNKGNVTVDSKGEGSINIPGIANDVKTEVVLDNKFCHTPLTIGDPPDVSSSSGRTCRPRFGANEGVATAIGCLPTDPKDLVNSLLTFAVWVSGAIAFLFMVIGAFQMITSAGNPDTLKAGQDKFTNAIVGLLIIILSVLLLQIIGADILSLPGFGR